LAPLVVRAPVAFVFAVIIVPPEFNVKVPDEPFNNETPKSTREPELIAKSIIHEIAPLGLEKVWVAEPLKLTEQRVDVVVVLVNVPPLIVKLPPMFNVKV
jgi:hypothetical protein